MSAAKIAVVVVAIGIAAVVWASGLADEIGCDSDAYRTATLDSLERNGLYPTSRSGCDWLEPCTAEMISDARKRANDIRKFAEAVKDRCAKAEFLGWAWYVDYRADEGEHQMKSHETRNEFDAIEKEKADTDRRAAELMKSLP